MTLELLNTGTELLLGHTLNSHLQYLAARLADCGLRIARQSAVPDGPEIQSALAEALDRSQIVIVTGGLGPTSDDLTRDATAALLGRQLRFNPEILARIHERFARRGLTPPDRVKVQAMVPDGAEILPNNHGTAPGLYLRDASRPGPERHIFLLPGPPRELHPMFEDSALPRLRALGASPLALRLLRTIGIPESHLQDRIEKPLLARFPDVEIGYCARPGEVDLRLVAPSAALADAAAAFATAEIGDALYATGHEDIEEVVVRLAATAGIRIALAESCTGGAIANRLTNVPGASAVFLGAAIVYSNAEKSRQLGVPPELIDRHGAVSAEVAAAMAAGCLERFGATLALATTGIAGPSGGSTEKPVGTCFFAWASAHRSGVERRTLPNDRPTFKYAASQAALDLLRQGIIA